MVLIRKGIGRELDRIHDHMERVFDRVFRQFPISASERGEVWSPNTDVFETETEFTILVEIAGVPKEDLEVIVQENLLCIRGNRPERPRERITRLHQMEINHGPFERIVSFPAGTDTERITAHYADGYLTIQIPKSGPSHGRVVEIETA